MRGVSEALPPPLEPKQCSWCALARRHRLRCEDRGLAAPGTV